MESDYCLAEPPSDGDKSSVGRQVLADDEDSCRKGTISSEGPDVSGHVLLVDGLSVVFHEAWSPWGAIIRL